MHCRPFHENDLPAIHAAFLEAFSDYAVPFRITRDEFEEMLRRRGYVPAASIGVFDDDRIVGFTLNGLGEWNGLRTGYDTGTGVVPSHRGRGLSRQMLDAATEQLHAHGASQYLLEVLKANERAFRVYRQAGFEVTREFQCWRVDAGDPGDANGVLRLAALDAERVAQFFDVAPSWQNSIESVQRAAARREVLGITDAGELVGCAVVFDNGDLPFLAVARSARRQGVGRKLLAAAAATRALRILNVDAAFRAGESFLQSCGAVRFVEQYEMMLEL